MAVAHRRRKKSPARAVRRSSLKRRQLLAAVDRLSRAAAFVRSSSAAKFTPSAGCAPRCSRAAHRWARRFRSDCPARIARDPRAGNACSAWSTRFRRPRATFFKHRLAHGIERVLHGFALVLGEHSEQTSRESSLAATAKATSSGAVFPIRSHRRAEQPVRGLRQSRQRILNIAFESRIRRLHDDQILEVPNDRELAALRARHFRRLRARRSTAQKSSDAAFRPSRRCSQAFSDIVTSAVRNLRIAPQQEIDQLLRELLHARGRRIARQRVHRVLHRVRRQNLAVVAVREAALEISLQQDLQRPFAKIVPVRDAASRAPAARAICRIDFRPAQSFGFSFPGTSCTRAGSEATECENALRHPARENVICTIGYNVSIPCAAK